MKALGKLKKEPGVWMYDAPMPEMGYHDVLIKVKKTGICGTDVHIYNWDEWAQKTIPVPMTIGHEFVGVIEKIGEGVRNLSVGQRVSGEGHINCGICRNCRSGRDHLCRNTVGVGVNRTGCFAEYIAIPANNVIIIPDEINDDLGAFLDPLGNAVHTALSFNVVGEDVLVTGAGPIGIMAAAVAHHVGGRHVVITDFNDYRLNLAKKVCPECHPVNVANQPLAEVMKKLRMREGFDVGLEMSGSPKALHQMIESVNYGANLALLGILPAGSSVDWPSVIFKGLTIKGIYGREMYETWYKMIGMLQSGLAVQSVITHVFPCNEYEKGFEVMRLGNSGKVILEWS